MTRAFCTAGTNESMKAAVHAAALGLAGTCFAYNLAAFRYRRERHLAVNAVVYLLAVGWEAKKVCSHLGWP